MESLSAGVLSDASVRLMTCVESPAVTNLTSYILFLTIGSVSAAEANRRDQWLIIIRDH